MWFVSPEERAKLTPCPHEPDADARVARGEPGCPCEVAGAAGTGVGEGSDSCLGASVSSFLLLSASFMSHSITYFGSFFGIFEFPKTTC